VRRKEGLNLLKKIGWYLTALALVPLPILKTRERERRVNERRLRLILRRKQQMETQLFNTIKKTLC
jgi:hypothetical protein